MSSVIRLSIFLLIFCFNSTFSTYQSRLYHLTCSDQSKVLYFRAQKCASGTVRELMHRHTKVSCDQTKQPFDPKKYADYFKFSIVRNPWDRAVSCYVGKVLGKRRGFFKECFDKDFEYFIDFIDRQDLSDTDRHITPQTLLIPYEIVNNIGRFENLENDLRDIFSQFCPKEIEIPHEHYNQRLYEHYSLYYTDRTREVIARKYNDDIEVFGYEFEDMKN